MSVSTCEARGIDPIEYIKDVLMRVDTHPASRIDKLLPHKWSPPLRGSSRRDRATRQSMAKPIAALYLWCYPDGSKNSAGWHFTADAHGCASLLLELDELASGRKEESRTLNVIPPMGTVLSLPGWRYVARSAQRLLLLVDRMNSRRFELRECDGDISLYIGVERLPELRARRRNPPRRR
jgi:hypothetical protein